MGYARHEITIIPENQELMQRFEDETWFINNPAEAIIFLSRQYPNYLIIVLFVGKKNEDIWKKAYFNGTEVWGWKLNIPEVPQEILDNAKREFAKHQRQNIQLKLKEMEEESKRLREILDS